MRLKAQGKPISEDIGWESEESPENKTLQVTLKSLDQQLSVGDGEDGGEDSTISTILKFVGVFASSVIMDKHF